MDNPVLFGNHRMDGILMAQGQHFGQGRWVGGAHITDVVPTILYLMGAKVPTDMDGRVLSEMFTEEFLRSNTIEWREPEEQRAVQIPLLSREDEAVITERLKKLGYL